MVYIGKWIHGKVQGLHCSFGPAVPLQAFLSCLVTSVSLKLAPLIHLNWVGEVVSVFDVTLAGLVLT